MKLPNGDRAVVDEGKLRDYLLSRSHPVGRFKADFFFRLGFQAEAWAALAERLKEFARDGEAEEATETEYGQKYLVSGTLTGPTGSSAQVVTVWIVPAGGDIPRLITVYPM